MENADKKNSAIRLLVALDENYLPQLQVLLTSISINSPQDVGALYLMHSGIPAESLQRVEKQCSALGCALHPVPVSADFFQEAPVTKRYPQEMYYRLLAPHLLPEDLDRILYLDPDILVINSLRPLWETDLKGCLFAAASHTGLTEIANDVNRILPLDDAVWNYDARNFNSYRLRSSGKADADWVIDNTAILHFCGRAKPWKPGYPYRFGILYKHYARLAQKWIAG